MLRLALTVRVPHLTAVLTTNVVAKRQEVVKFLVTGITGTRASACVSAVDRPTRNGQRYWTKEPLETPVSVQA